jgi:hypothetical protein
LQDPEFTYSVTIRLINPDDILGWDNVCARAIELFGLPGGRYITDIGNDRMDWIFKDSKDALLFKLKFSEVAV